VYFLLLLVAVALQQLQLLSIQDPLNLLAVQFIWFDEGSKVLTIFLVDEMHAGYEQIWASEEAAIGPSYWSVSIYPHKKIKHGDQV
jgi:hypothetical protein